MYGEEPKAPPFLLSLVKGAYYLGMKLAFKQATAS
jgi:hypothetical protein